MVDGQTTHREPTHICRFCAVGIDFIQLSLPGQNIFATNATPSSSDVNMKPQRAWWFGCLVLHIGRVVRPLCYYGIWCTSLNQPFKSIPLLLSLKEAVGAEGYLQQIIHIGVHVVVKENTYLGVLGCVMPIIRAHPLKFLHNFILLPTVKRKPKYIREVW